MDWKQAIENWRRLPPEERLRQRLASVPEQVWQSMAFEREPVDLNWLKALHNRRTPPAPSTPPSVN